MKRLGCRETTFFFSFVITYVIRKVKEGDNLLFFCVQEEKRKGHRLASFSAEEGGFEPPVQLPVRQFSKLLVSATHPPFLDNN